MTIAESVVFGSAATGTANALNIVAPVPVYPVGASSKDKATIIEIMAVEVFFDPNRVIAVSAFERINEIHWWLSHSALVPAVPTAVTNIAANTAVVRPGMVTMGQGQSVSSADGTSVTAISDHNNTWRIDMSDGAGHGLLYPYPDITLSIVQRSAAAAYWLNFTVVYRINFRYKSVALAEYIGLTQTS